MILIITNVNTASIGLWILLILPFNTAVSVSSVKCNYSHEYKITNKNGDEYCRPCTVCRPGTGVLKPCSKDHNIICSKCTNGTFSHGGHRPCRPCKQCVGDFHVARACAPHRNSHCKICKPGRYFEPKRRKCRKCRMCPPGTYVKHKCSPLQNTECAACPFGTFSDEFNSFPFCKPCTRCQPLEQIRQFCNITHNSICGDCKTGYFRLESTLNCAQCSDCYLDNPGYTFAIPECVRTVNDSRYTCMPMLRPPFRSLTTAKTLIQFSTGFYQSKQRLSSSSEDNDDKDARYIAVILGSSVLTIFILCVVILGVIMCLKQFDQKFSWFTFVRKGSSGTFSQNKMISSLSSHSCSDSILYRHSEYNRENSKIATIQRMSKSLNVSTCLLNSEDIDNYLNEKGTIQRNSKFISPQKCVQFSTKKCIGDIKEEKTHSIIEKNRTSSKEDDMNYISKPFINSSIEECRDFEAEGGINCKANGQSSFNKDEYSKPRVKNHIESGNSRVIYLHKNTQGCIDFSSSGSLAVKTEENVVNTICYPTIVGHDTDEGKEESLDDISSGTVQSCSNESVYPRFVDVSTLPKTNSKFKFCSDFGLKRTGYYSN